MEEEDFKEDLALELCEQWEQDPKCKDLSTDRLHGLAEEAIDYFWNRMFKKDELQKERERDWETRFD